MGGVPWTRNRGRRKYDPSQACPVEDEAAAVELSVRDALAVTPFAGAQGLDRDAEIRGSRLGVHVALRCWMLGEDRRDPLRERLKEIVGERNGDARVHPSERRKAWGRKLDAREPQRFAKTCQARVACKRPVERKCPLCRQNVMGVAWIEPATLACEGLFVGDPRERLGVRPRKFSARARPTFPHLAPGCPRPESNQRTRFRKPLLYRLSSG
jgi:hypothetical protein